MMKKYQITLITIYGSLTIDDIEAKQKMKLLKLQNKKHKTNWIALKLMKCTAMSSLMAHNVRVFGIRAALHLL